MSKLFSAWLPSPEPHFPALRLTSTRLVIRPPHPVDWGDWAALREESRDHLVPFEPQWGLNALSQDAFERKLARQSRDWQAGLSCSFLIFLPGENKLIGGVNLNNICRGAAQYASLGYWLGEQYQGHGYMMEALSQVITYGFGAQGLHRINAATLPHNGRSMKLLRRLGFEEEGFAKSYIQINGEWQDHILFGMTADIFHGKIGVLA